MPARNTWRAWLASGARPRHSPDQLAGRVQAFYNRTTTFQADFTQPTVDSEALLKIVPWLKVLL
jgi:hypothetical protein